jgi:hypothetical protein
LPALPWQTWGDPDLPGGSTMDASILYQIQIVGALRSING